MKRVERELFRINETLHELRQESTLMEAELSALRSIDDDAQRDAVLGIDRLEATSTRDDVKRFETALAKVALRIDRLSARRARLLRRLG